MPFKKCQSITCSTVNLELVLFRIQISWHSRIFQISLMLLDISLTVTLLFNRKHSRLYAIIMYILIIKVLLLLVRVMVNSSETVVGNLEEVHLLVVYRLLKLYNTCLKWSLLMNPLKKKMILTWVQLMDLFI